MKNFNKVKPTAKLKRSLFWDFGKGTINLSSNAVSFMVNVIDYVSKDGRILCNDAYIRKALKIQDRTLKRIILELKGLGLITEKEGYLYSNFHVLYNQKDKDSSYIKSLVIFKSAEFMKLTKQQKRLFFYISAKGRIEGTHKFYVEAFYKNMYHINKIDYYATFKEFCIDLLHLVEQGFLDVSIDQKWYNSKSTDFEKIFKDYCGVKSDLEKKQRINKHDKHKFCIRVSTSIAANASENRSAEYELELLAERYSAALEFVRKDSLNKLIGIQNDLFERFNECGMTIYRETIEKYFIEDGGDFIYFDEPQDTKLVNYYVNHHLLPYLSNLIVAVAAKNPFSKELDAFFDDAKNLDLLITYYNDKSVVNHQILLVDSLEKNSVKLDELQDLISDTIDSELIVGVDRLIETTRKVAADFERLMPNVTPAVQKRVMNQCASEGLLFEKDVTKHILHYVKGINNLPTIFNEQNLLQVNAETTKYVETNNTNKEKSVTAEAERIRQKFSGTEYEAKLLQKYYK